MHGNGDLSLGKHRLGPQLNNKRWVKQGLLLIKETLLGTKALVLTHTWVRRLALAGAGQSFWIGDNGRRSDKLDRPPAALMVLGHDQGTDSSRRGSRRATCKP